MEFIFLILFLVFWSLYSDANKHNPDGNDTRVYLTITFVSFVLMFIFYLS
jgi:hypothetical protein